MYKDILVQLGLNQNEAIIYEYLLKNGERSAGEVIKKTPLKRGLVYLVLGELVKKGLILEKKKDKVALFSPAHPQILEERLANEEALIKKAKFTLEANLAMLVSDFNLVSGRPGVRSFEGVVGLSKIYDEILKDGKDFLLVRSIHEPVYTNKMLPVVKRFIKERVAKNISVTAITPTDIEPDTEQDKQNLFTRYWVPKELYSAPVEIDVFGDKVAMLSFGKELVGTIIESEQIADAMRQLFGLAVKNINQTDA